MVGKGPLCASSVHLFLFVLGPPFHDFDLLSQDSNPLGHLFSHLLIQTVLISSERFLVLPGLISSFLDLSDVFIAHLGAHHPLHHVNIVLECA